MDKLLTMRRVLVASGALILGALACSVPGVQGPDTGSTVQAVYATITQQANLPTLTSTPLVATAPPLATTPTSTYVLPGATSVQSSRGTLTTIHRCVNAVTIDAKDDDWPGSATSLIIDKVTFDPNQEWSGPDDLLGNVKLCWTDDTLFLLANVIDDVHFQSQRGGDSYKGDEVELMFDSNLRSDFSNTEWNQDDYQLSLNPDDFGTTSPAAYRYRPTAGLPSGVKVAAKLSGVAADYLLEAGIPWAELGGKLVAGQNYGLCVALSDDDHPDRPAQQDTLMTHCAGLYVPDPTTWASVTFGP